MADDERSFPMRWSQRKAQVRKGVVPAEPAAPTTAPAKAPLSPTAPPPASATGSEVPLPPLPPLPTMDDVAALGHASDYSRFVAPGVEAGVRNAAMKKLFTDPRFNVMDGLDIYIDDYGRPDPIAPEMLRRMVQSKALGLFDHEEGDAASAAAAPSGIAAAAGGAADNAPQDDHTDLQLQPDHAAGRGGADEGAGPGPV